jgi:beta-galactosidase
MDPLFATLDVAGYNYEIARAPADHARLPGRVIVSTESFPNAGFENWSAVQRQPYVIGEFVWTAMDYLGEAGIGRAYAGRPALTHWKANMWPWHGSVCGDIDLTGWRRPVSHYRNILWNRGERLYAAVTEPIPGGGEWSLDKWATTPALPSWTWPDQEGKPLTVEVYSRYDAVRLTLDGRVIGEKPTGEAQEFKADFAVPYAPGTLRAIGLSGGREAETFTLRTAGPIAGLRLTADRTALRADGQDLAFVTIEAVDARGNWVPTAAGAVSCAVEGAGSLAGLGNADAASLEPYRADPHSLYQGRLLAVVRTGAAPGTIRLRAEVAGAPPAAVELQTR